MNAMKTNIFTSVNRVIYVSFLLLDYTRLYRSHLAFCFIPKPSQIVAVHISNRYRILENPQLLTVNDVPHCWDRISIYPSFQIQRKVKNLYDDSYDVDLSDEISDQPYWESDEFTDSDQDDFASTPTTGSLLEYDVLEWEKCSSSTGTAWVLLPPPSVTKPTCIVHFVGGTYLGSAPNVWYRAILQDIVRHTSCVIVATSIPITVSRSPLNHVRLVSQLIQQLQTAYQDILVDEYGLETMQTIPLCAIGHSLGARLLTVLATTSLGRIKMPSHSFSDKRQQNPFLSYKSFILICFTNYGAAAGIPGIAQLLQKSRMMERRKKQQGGSQSYQRKNGDGWYDDSDENDIDDDDADDWLELWNEVTGAVQAGATRVQNALTPSSKSLEFYPTPEQLWNAINQDHRYTIPQTLIVQFDDDEIDQSSILASAIANFSDTKFARIRGTHLTPISIYNDGRTSHQRNGESMSFLQQINSRAGRLIVKALQGRQGSKRNEIALIELRQSIARYITEIVTKE